MDNNLIKNIDNVINQTADKLLINCYGIEHQIELTKALAELLKARIKVNRRI